MSDTEFDRIESQYEELVERSIEFSGLGHDFFMAAKADLLGRIAASHFPDRQNLNLLDVGCGVGRLHPHLKGQFASISGCDVSEKSVARARRDNPFADYAVSAESGLPYADAGFDIVLTACVMHHVPPAQWVSFLAEMRRVLRPGGVAVIIEHNPFNPLTRLAVARCPFDVDAVLLSSGKSRRLLLEAGFARPQTQNFLFLPTAAPAARRFEQAFKWLPLGAQYAAIGTA
ncbi:class I SAM-dependent methyltransferase [Devosia sp. CAU 1758]